MKKCTIFALGLMVAYVASVGIRGPLISALQPPRNNSADEKKKVDAAALTTTVPQPVPSDISGAHAACSDYHRNSSLFAEATETYCNWTFDGFLCWPPTKGGQKTEQMCPPVHLSDRTQMAFRLCGKDGQWAGRDINPNGWTNFTSCFPAVVQDLLNKVNRNDARIKFLIAAATRQIEIYGFAISFVLLTISLIIFHSFECLNNERIKIHKNLFLAMDLQVLLRLIIYIDQAIVRANISETTSAIEKVQFLCKSMYLGLEYLINSMFMWMLNEGISLNRIVTKAVMRFTNYTVTYLVLGWIVPLVNTIIWTVVVANQYSKDNTLGCWYGYNFDLEFWIMQGPRLTVILINLGFLLNIMWMLVLKLKEDTTSDIVKARKAVKAAFVLLPLLGITNILGMFHGPVSGPAWHFAVWSYITHFLRSFQGAIIACLYCFRNEEVRAVLTRSASTRLAIFRHRHPRVANAVGLGRRQDGQRFPRGRGRGSGDGDSGDVGGPNDMPMVPVREFRSALRASQPAEGSTQPETHREHAVQWSDHTEVRHIPRVVTTNLP